MVACILQIFSSLICLSFVVILIFILYLLLEIKKFFIHCLYRINMTSTQELVVLTNIASASTTLIRKISLSSYVVYNEKLKNFMDRTLKCENKKYFFI